LGKPVDDNLFPAFQDSLDSRLDERKKDYIEELEKVKNEGVVLRFEEATDDLPP